MAYYSCFNIQLQVSHVPGKAYQIEALFSRRSLTRNPEQKLRQYYQGTLDIAFVNFRN